MPALFIFHLALSGEWLSTAIGIAITYAVFIMGVPALIFQTFIPEGLRNLYKERLMRGWFWIFGVQMALIFTLLVIGNPGVCGIEEEERKKDTTPTTPALAIAPSQEAKEGMAFFTLSLVLVVLIIGHWQLVKTFRNAPTIGQNLSRKIVTHALETFKQKQEVDKKDLDDLALLAKELGQGEVKNTFLEECERLVENLPKLATKPQNADKNIGEALEKALCPSVTTDGMKANADNMRKALEVLTLVYNQVQMRNQQAENENKNYLITIVGNCIREIGIKGIMAKDFHVVMLAIGKLSSIDGSSRDMFSLGDAALQHGYVEAAVIMTRKLGDRVRQQIEHGYSLSFKDKRTYAWVGLVSRLHQKGGHAQQYAERQLQNIIEQRNIDPEEIKLLFKTAPIYFYQLADFTTADAIQELQEKRYP